MGSLAKERISELESMTMETFKIKKQREKRLLKNPTKQNIQELWNNLKSATGLAVEEREIGTEAIYETIMTENFPKLMLDNKPWIQEAHKTASMINAKTKQNNTKNYT